MHKTVTALMARGMDRDAAEKIVKSGLTIKTLKQKRKADLVSIGVPAAIAENLLKEQRPPIPSDTLIKLLFDNKYMCCVCRDSSKSIIVHHIDEWADSHSHDIGNLAVLCLHHHDEAHSKKTLSQNLDPKTIRKLKEAWENEAKQHDARSILDAMALEYSTWNYMNELRIFDLALQNNIDPKSVRLFDDLVAIGVASPNGLPSPVNDEGKFYKYQGEHILQRYFYVSQVFNLVIKRISIVNISDHLDKGVLSTVVIPGDFIFVQGRHVFSPITEKKNGTGSGQHCRGVRSVNDVEVTFVFDRWEATSSSAKSIWLTGTQNQGSLLHVKDVSRADGKVIISGTALGICSNRGDLKKRDYAASLWESGSFKNSYAHMIDEEDFDQEDEDEDEALI